MQAVAPALTERQSQFVHHLARGVAQTDAARLSGYTHPHEEAHRLTRHPGVAAAVAAETDRIVKLELAPMALCALKRLLGEGQPWAAQLGAAKTVLTHVRELAAKNKDDTKNFAGMSLAELEREFTAMLARRTGELVDVTDSADQNAEVLPPLARKPRASRARKQQTST